MCESIRYRSGVTRSQLDRRQSKKPKRKMESLPSPGESAFLRIHNDPRTLVKHLSSKEKADLRAFVDHIWRDLGAAVELLEKYGVQGIGTMACVECIGTSGHTIPGADFLDKCDALQGEICIAHEDWWDANDEVPFSTFVSVAMNKGWLDPPTVCNVEDIEAVVTTLRLYKKIA